MRKDILKELCVLYAEDDDIILLEATSMIGGLFKKFDVVTDGLSALEMYKQNHYDIVITDVTMPRLDGLGLVGQIKALNSNQIIIVTSSMGDSQFIIELINEGVNRFLNKPIDYKKLLNLLEYYAAMLDNEKKALKYQAEMITKNEELNLAYKELKGYKSALEFKIKYAVDEINALNSEIENTQKEIIFTMGALCESKSMETSHHVKRVAEYSRLLAVMSGFSASERRPCPHFRYHENSNEQCKY